MRLYLKQTLLVFLGCACCLMFKDSLSLGAVTAAALTGLIGSFVHLPRLIDRDQLQAAVYTGAFIGMGSPEILSQLTDAIGVSLVGAGVFLLLRPFGAGIGGKMGTVAFFSSFFFLVFRRAFAWWG